MMDEKERRGPDLSSEELYPEAGAVGGPSGAREGTAGEAGRERGGSFKSRQSLPRKAKRGSSQSGLTPRGPEALGRLEQDMEEGPRLRVSKERRNLKPPSVTVHVCALSCAQSPACLASGLPLAEPFSCPRGTPHWDNESSLLLKARPPTPHHSPAPQRWGAQCRGAHPLPGETDSYWTATRQDHLSQEMKADSHALTSLACPLPLSVVNEDASGQTRVEVGSSALAFHGQAPVGQAFQPDQALPPPLLELSKPCSPLAPSAPTQPHSLCTHLSKSPQEEICTSQCESESRRSPRSNGACEALNLFSREGSRTRG